LTVYYIHGDKASLDAVVEGFVGEGNWSAIYQESIFTVSGGIYTFAGFPGGWAVVTGYTTPPVCTSAYVYKTQLKANGTVLLGGDTDINGYFYNNSLTDGLRWAGKADFGSYSADKGLTDYGIYLNKPFADSGATATNAGLGFVISLNATANSTANYYPIFGQTTVYITDSNYSYAESAGSYNALVLIGSTGTNTLARYFGAKVQPLSFISSTGTLTVADWRSFYGGTFTGVTGLSATTAYSFYAEDLSGSATTSWGVYNLDRTYLGKDVVLPTSTGVKIGTSTSQLLGFWNATPVNQPDALTAGLTTVTFTAPGTADYAIQDFVDVQGDGSKGFSFKNKDEANTVLKVVANLQTKVEEIESRMEELGLISA
jgi:hypothetical protein